MPRATGRATDRAVDRLHRLVAKALTKELNRAVRSKEPVPAALLTAGIQFLRANGVDRPARDTGPIDELASRMPDLTDFTADADTLPPLKGADEDEPPRLSALDLPSPSTLTDFGGDAE